MRRPWICAAALFTHLISSLPCAYGGNVRSPIVTSVDAISGNEQLKSVEGRKITVLHFPALKSTSRSFYIQGGLHGNEKLSSGFVLWLLQRFRNGQSRLNALDPLTTSIDFVPVANPDGMNAISRNNARNVNLNRNFEILWGISKENPGTSSFSEPETQSIRYMIETRHYTAAIDVHGYTNWIVLPSQPENIPSTRVTKERAGLYRMWSDFVAALTRKTLAHYELKTARGLGDGGAFEDWTFWQAGTFAFCLELESPLLTSGSDQEFERYEALIFNAFQKAAELSP